MPAAKKDSSVRSRRNVASTASLLPAAGSSVKAPDLPSRYSDEGIPIQWKPETLQWWADLWAAPMSTEYHSSDRHALFMLAVLMDEFWTEPSTKLAAEIRLQRVAFGLTPYDRRRLEWTIATTEETKTRVSRGRNPSAAQQPKPSKDPRSVLRAV